MGFNAGALDQQGSSLGLDAAFNAAFNAPGDGAGAGATASGSSGGSWDGASILQGLMGPGVGPEMRQQYMKKLNLQLERAGMNKKQLVEMMRAKGPVAALRTIGMMPLSSELGAGGAMDGSAAVGASTPSAAAAAAGLDPAMAAAMPSDAAFPRMRQQQQALSGLGPSQQAWLLHNQQAAGLGGADGLASLLGQQQQQQQWQGSMGMPGQSMRSGYPSLMGPSLYGMDGMLGGDMGMWSTAGLAGMAGMLDGMGGLMGGTQGLMMQQQQQPQQQHPMAFGNAVGGPYQQQQQPHTSMGMLAQQQYLYQQQQMGGAQLGQQPGLQHAAAGAAGSWGSMMGMGLQQGMQGPGSSAALDPPVLELPHLSPIKTSLRASSGGLPGGLPSGLPSSFTAGAAAAAAASCGAAGTAAAPDGLGAAGSSQVGAGVGAAAGGLDRGHSGQQQLLHPLHLPGSLAELTGDDDGIALSPFGQLGLNAADVDALLSGFEPC
jgi:hypothetical protein